MTAGDRLLVYSPKTSYPDGHRFQAIAIVGVVTGEEPEPSTVITGGFRRRADLREIDPLPLALLRDHLPTSRIRRRAKGNAMEKVMWLVLVRPSSSRPCAGTSGLFFGPSAAAGRRTDFDRALRALDPA